MVNNMHYSSTTGQVPPSAWCVVYDPETGAVVHMHGFTGFDLAADTDWARTMRAEAALAHVRKHVRKGAKNLEVAHGDPKKLPEPGARFSVDVKKKKVVVSSGSASLQALLKAQPKAGAGTSAESKAPKKR